ncbi:DNA polymerase ligase N-terminal domain-containing protein [Sinorhizobium medicae]|uniref:DNA polymerase ligase N-terminal domain-containing protein n=1 Tax=Sinorhizobium medicae TaxID=110321 RepID=UPI00040535D1|nr:DNA polymerase ligase N-terminal domain-containing protein [Sinorhizobium medicae]
MANDKLSTYKKKRDFKQAQEPSGAAAVKSSNRLRFIIQKHDPTRLHYDLRPELDGVFKSWAVTTTCSPLPPVVLQKPDTARRSARKPLSWAEAQASPLTSAKRWPATTQTFISSK